MKSCSKSLRIGVIALLLIFLSCQSENKIVHQQFKSEKVKVLVCPTHILENNNSTYDAISSLKIVEYINEKKYADAVVTFLLPEANNVWRHNEAKMLTISINYFIELVKKSNLPNNTYVLYTEFLKIGKDSSILAVHYCLLNNKGEIAMRGLINSHWPAYQQVKPKNNDDCIAVFKLSFDEKMQ